MAGRAPAKINLYLRVTGRRPDGYHELDSIFLPVSIYDCLKIELRTPAPRSVILRCNRQNVPTGEENLAVRAAIWFLRTFGIDAAATIELEKEIPVGAGLGGGSSDAGAVLRMMHELARIEINDRTRGLAAALGADVPFFLDPRPARVRGKGEWIEPLQRMPRPNLVIAVPPIEVHTVDIFGKLRPDHWSGPANEDEIETLCGGEIRSALLVNDLAPVAMELYPEIRRLRTLLERLGAHTSAMTGSGGAVFGVFSGPDEAVAAASRGAVEAPEAFIRAAIVPEL